MNIPPIDRPDISGTIDAKISAKEFFDKDSEWPDVIGGGQAPTESATRQEVLERMNQLESKTLEELNALAISTLEACKAKGFEFRHIGFFDKHYFDPEYANTDKPFPDSVKKERTIKIIMLAEWLLVTDLDALDKVEGFEDITHNPL